MNGSIDTYVTRFSNFSALKEISSYSGFLGWGRWPNLFNGAGHVAPRTSRDSHVDVFWVNHLTLSVLSFNICNVRWLHSYGGARYRVPAQLYRRIDVSRFVEFFLKIISILHGARSQSVRFVECQIINVICVINCVWRNIWDKSRLYLATKAL